MRVIVTIGHTDILLPDDTGVATIMKALSKGVKVYDHIYKGEIELQADGNLEVAMKYVPDSVRYVANGQPVKVFNGRTVRHHTTTAGQLQIEG